MQHVADSRWLMLAVLFLAGVTLGYQFQWVASTALLLVEQLGCGYAQVGTLVGMYMLPGVVIALSGGLLGHRFGDKASRASIRHHQAGMGQGSLLMRRLDDVRGEFSLTARLQHLQCHQSCRYIRADCGSKDIKNLTTTPT